MMLAMLYLCDYADVSLGNNMLVNEGFQLNRKGFGGREGLLMNTFLLQVITSIFGQGSGEVAIFCFCFFLILKHYYFFFVSLFVSETTRSVL